MYDEERNDTLPGDDDHYQEEVPNDTRKETINGYMTDVARCAYEAGMTFAGFNEEGQFEFMGTEIQWRRFRDMVSDSEITYA